MRPTPKGTTPSSTPTHTQASLVPVQEKPFEVRRPTGTTARTKRSETKLKEERVMQTKLRIVSLLFVVSLLWTSPMSAANAKSQISKAHTAPNPRYTGVASWYGADRQGRKMADGRKFDRRAMTAACWYYPLGTVIRVVNLSNGNGVTVTVTDRGPNL